MKTRDDIKEADKNLGFKTSLERDGICFTNALEAPLSVCGLMHTEGLYRRIPRAVAEATSSGVVSVHDRTAGGRLRFRTDSPYIAIRSVMPTPSRLSVSTAVASAGYDLYIDGSYRSSFIPPEESDTLFENIYDLTDDIPTRVHEILIHFPIYSRVSDLFVGIKEGSVLEAPTPYRGKKPIVYYGSSITQGGCANRPGMTYTNQLSRRLDYDHINLGFSGSAGGDQSVAEHIAALDMAAFVFDYDHNAPDTEFLARTHESFFMTIRKAQPNLPIIIMPRPKFIRDEDTEARAKIIKRTYDNAVARGDANVYYISGEELTALCKNEGTVDFCHPTDLGFLSMANAVAAVLEPLLSEV